MTIFMLDLCPLCHGIVISDHISSINMLKRNGRLSAKLHKIADKI